MCVGSREAKETQHRIKGAKLHPKEERGEMGVC